MLEVKFYDTVDDSLLKFAVIISLSNGKWVFCKHKERDTYEAPGGHREVGEDILETAKRELQEETGAIRFDIKPICVYSVTGKNSVNETGEETFGLLCFAEITEFSGKLESEMEKVELMFVVEKESYAYYRRALETGEHIAYLVYDNGAFVGAGGVSFYQVMPTYHNPTGKKAYIMNMYAAPEYRRQGIAIHTLDLLVKDAKEQGVLQIALEATYMGRPLYERYGFAKMEDEMELVW